MATERAGYPVEAGPRLFDVVRDVVAEAAPAELPLLEALGGLDDEEIGRVLLRRSKGEDPLGFGAGEIAVLVAPVVWGAVQYVANQAAGRAAERLGTRARAVLRRVLKRPAAAPLPRFGDEELRAVHARVVESALRAGMKRARAEQLADSVVGRLAITGEQSGE
ncbi:hypothetical protein [Longispora albida]|uniref:hypothetical protein n=1 Tax=Longispora albida TaxID=203523 RepID=UPI00037C9854|nr:hypothetical protein [Longispora albida]